MAGNIDRLDSIADVPAIEAELKAIIGGLRDVKDFVQSIGTIEVQTKGAEKIEQINTSAKKLNETLEQTASINQQIVVTQQKVNAVMTSANQSLEDNIKSRRILKNTIEGYLKDQKEDLALLKQNTITQAEYSKRVSETGVKIELLKTQVSELNKTIKGQIITTAQASKADKELSNDYLQLSLASKAASDRAKQYAASLGLQHPVTIVAVADAQKLRAQLVAIDASVGESGKNVGNYSNSVTKAAGSVFGAVRKIAYILPGIGIAGIFSAVFTGIISIFEQGDKKLDELKDSLKKTLDDLLKSTEDIKRAATEGNAGDIAKVNALAAAVLDQTKSYKERNAALNQLKEINKAYFGDLTVETAALGGLKKAVDDYTDAIIANAVVKGFADEIGKVSVELSKQLDAYNKLGNQLDELNRKRENTKRYVTTEGNLGQEIINESGAYKTLTGEINKTQKQMDLVGGATSKLGLQMTNLKTSIKNAVNESLKFKPLDEKETKGNNKAAKDAQKQAEDNLKALFEIQQLQLKRTADFNKAIAADESNSYIDRLKALRLYYEATQEIIDNQTKFDLVTGDKSNEEKKLVLAKQYDELLRLDKTYLTERDKLWKAFAKAIVVTDQEMQDDLAKGIKKAFEKFEKDLDDKAKKRKKDAKDQEKEDEELAKAKADLEKKLASEITTVVFTVIDAKFEKEKNALQDQIDLLEEKKRIEIEGVNASIASNQDKAAQIALIEARAAAQKAQLQRKQRDLDIKKAEFDKYESIARVVQEMAIAITSSLTKPALIPYIIGIGAAQLAAIIARPIPRYGEGIEDHPGGLAEVGDKGKAEAVKIGEKYYKTPSTSTIVNLPKGAKVYPDFSKLKLTGVPEFKQANYSNSDNAVKAIGKDIVKAIENQPKVIIKTPSRWSQYINKGSSFTEYLNRNL